MSDRPLLPSEKAKQKEERDRVAREQYRQSQEKLRGAVSRISATEDGRIFLEWLCNKSGWGNSYLALNSVSGEIDEKRTVCQAFNINLWWEIRKLIPIQHRIEVEDVEV